MQELEDYSGAFKPDLKLQDLSKDALARLFLRTCRLYIGFAALVYELNKEKFGEKVAIDLDTDYWLKMGAAEREVRLTTKAMNIVGNDITSLFKYLQVGPGAWGTFLDFSCEVKSESQGILTVKECRPLNYFEDVGDMVSLQHACDVEDREVFKRVARFFNPDIEVVSLKLPPRKSKDEIACQWEFRLGA